MASSRCPSKDSRVALPDSFRGIGYPSFMTPTFSHDPGLRLFIADVEGTQATVAYDPVDEHTLDFVSTYVPHVLRHQHLGSQLVRHALGWARDNGMRVVPSCWFVRQLMDREAEWNEMIATR